MSKFKNLIINNDNLPPKCFFNDSRDGEIDLIIKNLKERNIPVIIISHNLRQVFDLVDKIAVFRQGRIIDVVKTSEVTGNDVVALITGLDKKNREVGEYI